MDQKPGTDTRGGHAARIALVVVFALALTAFFALDLDKRFSLPGLKASADVLRQWVAQQPVASAAGFFALYVAVAGLGLPAAAVLTVAAGALFGFAEGLLLASFASTLGATVSSLCARYVLRGWVRTRFGARLAVIDQGVAREGGFYLFSMRLIPVLPFFVINLLMGLTPMPARTFAWVSQAGMLPGTMVFVYAGTRLAQIQSLSDVASPGLLAALVLMGLLPLAARRLVAWLRGRRKV